MKKYRVTYFYEQVNDYGGIESGHAEMVVSGDRVQWYEEARKGKTIAGTDYIKVGSIRRIK